MMQDAAWPRRPLDVGGFKSLMLDERGDALAEYALISAIFAMAMLGALHLIANELGNNLSRTGNSLTNLGYTP
jgi:Flp pilus assembly pilin Flp